MLLAIVERNHRGAVESQFADVFYVARELHRQLDGVDLVLRGAAVNAAVHAPPPDTPADLPGIWLPPQPPDPQDSVAALIADGMRVYVETADLAPFGLADAPVLPGIRPDAPAWDAYDGVWFL
jgi:hypothetical protein